MAGHGAIPLRGERQVALSPIHEGRFGRMFRSLPAAPKLGEAKLKALATLMTDTATPPAGDNPAIPSGYTYFGQFVDHDITFDPNSSLQKANDPDALHNFRSPKYDLDSVYGSGPDDEPFMYVTAADGKIKFLIDEENVHGERDLPRNENEVALIGDPRNDENTIVNQMQLLWIRLHNKLTDTPRMVRAGASARELFDEVQRHVRWTYQRVVVHDFLRRIVGAELLDELLTINPITGRATIGNQFYKPKNDAYMPVEFSVAAYRFGHSQVRERYDLNNIVTGVPIFKQGQVGLLDDLRGFRAIPGQWTVKWDRFLDIPGGGPVQPSRAIDSKLTPALQFIPGKDRPLALLNLMRGEAMGLPSGQAVAEHLGVPLLTTAELGKGVPTPTPLWFYLLKESEVRHGGEQLGAVGGRIVAEVFLGLLTFDKTSWINVSPRWKSKVPAAGTHLTLADVAAFVG